MPPTPPLPHPSPERKALQERNPSETNRIARRTQKPRPKHDSTSSTPYPTKSSHILSPTTARTQYGARTILPFPTAPPLAETKEDAGGLQHYSSSSPTYPKKTLTVKRSVSELRSLYERQASPAKPATSFSSRLAAPKLSSHPDQQRIRHQGHGNQLTFPPVSDETASSQIAARLASSIKIVQPTGTLPAPPSLPPACSPPPSRSLGSPTETAIPRPRASSSPGTDGPPTIVSDPEGPSSLSSSPNFVLLAHTSSQSLDSGSSISNPSILQIPPPLYLGLDPIPPLRLRGVQTDRPSSLGSESGLTSSSPNVVKLRTSSPTHDMIRHHSSPTSFPTSPSPVRGHHYETGHDQSSISTRSSFSQRFDSSPPDPGVSTPSLPTFDDPLLRTPRPLPAVPGYSAGSRAHEHLQSALESSPAPEIRYPLVPAPRTHSWEDLNVPKRGPRYKERPTPWNPYLSTVPSEWSGENQMGSFHTVGTDDLSHTQSMVDPSEADYLSYPTFTELAASTAGVRLSLEANDILSDLGLPQLRHQTSGLVNALSDKSRTVSFGSFVLRSHASNGSLQTAIRFPAWACRYYSRGLGDSFNPLRPDTAQSAVRTPSPPTTAVTPPIEQTIAAFSRPRMRVGKGVRDVSFLSDSGLGFGPLNSNPSPSRITSLAVDPADPRAHWAGAEQEAIEAALQYRGSLGPRVPNEWSPRLFPDSWASDRHQWLAPSIDERSAPVLTWRNAHVIGFMLGFIFPLSWFVAALLPLPPKPVLKEMIQEPDTGGSNLQQQLDHHASRVEEIRYINLRWWRNLNRFMCVVGLVVIAIIITLAVVGTRRGSAV